VAKYASNDDKQNFDQTKLNSSLAEVNENGERQTGLKHLRAIGNLYFSIMTRLVGVRMFLFSKIMFLYKKLLMMKAAFAAF